jgi:excisionase family DNA binding protein
MPADPGSAQPTRLISIAEAASRLGISESAAYRLAAAGGLPGQVKLPGARMRVRARVLDAWLDGTGADVPERTPAPGVRPARLRRPWR